MTTARANIFLIGAPKAGSSYLANWLARTGRVCAPPRKEVNYFSASDLQRPDNYYRGQVNVRSEDEYRRLFRRCSRCDMLLDASVSYWDSQNAAVLIREYNPEARLIVLLRDPVERAWSHCLMDRAAGYTSQSIEDVLYADWSFEWQQWIGLGQYERILKKWLAVWPRTQIGIWESDRLFRSPLVVIKELCDWLTLDKEDFEQLVKAEVRFDELEVNGYREGQGVLGEVYRSKMARSIGGHLPSQVRKLGKRIVSRKTNKPRMPLDVERKLERIYVEDLEFAERELAIQLRHRDASCV